MNLRYSLSIYFCCPCSLNLSVYNRNCEVQKYKLYSSAHGVLFVLRDGLMSQAASGSSQAAPEAAQRFQWVVSTLSTCPVTAALCRPKLTENRALVMATSKGLRL